MKLWVVTTLIKNHRISRNHTHAECRLRSAAWRRCGGDKHTSPPFLDRKKVKTTKFVPIRIIFLLVAKSCAVTCSRYSWLIARTCVCLYRCSYLNTRESRGSRWFWVNFFFYRKTLFRTITFPYFVNRLRTNVDYENNNYNCQAKTKIVCSNVLMQYQY